MPTDIINPIFLLGVIGFLVVWLLVPLIQKWNYSRLLEARPGAARRGPAVSRLGGVALAAAFGAIAVVALFWFPAAADAVRLKTRWVIVATSLAMFLLGLWDDLKPLGAKRKLAGQILIALVVCFCGVRIGKFLNPFNGVISELGWLGWPATVFWLVALTNIINLIDGIDGLAGGVALMLMGLLVYLGVGEGVNFPLLCAAGMCGALLGFLRYNFPPAKIYMGDGGAYFLGFLIGMLTLVHSQKGTIVAALIAPVFALALPILDVALAILRRGIKGLPIFRPDRRHIHHRLLASGFSHRRTVLTLYAVSLACLVMALSLFWSQGRLLPILCGFMFLLVLVAVRSLGLGRDWFAVDGAVGNVLRLRKETRYALCLSQWLELEAERCATPADLWAAYVFFVQKVGFARMKFIMDDGAVDWTPAANPAAEKLQTLSLAIGVGNIQAIEFSAARAAMLPKLFELLAELAVEAWVRAVLRWEAVNGRPFQMPPPAK